MRQLLFLFSILFLFSCQPQEKAMPVKIYSDVDSALFVAKQTHRPILAYYSAYAGVNCRKMEDRLFKTPKVSRALNDFVIVELMVDDRKALPDSLQGDYCGRSCYTFGQWYAAMEQQQGKSNAQPFFLFYNESGRLLQVEGRSYTLGEDAFLDFLAQGKAASGTTGEQLSALPYCENATTGDVAFPAEDTTASEINSWTSKDNQLHWSVSAKQLGPQQAQITFETDLPNGVILYALNQPDKNSPTSELLIDNLLRGELQSLPEQPGTKSGYDNIMQCRTVFFERHVKMTQVIDYYRALPHFITGVLQVFYSDQRSIHIDSGQFRVKIN